MSNNWNDERQQILQSLQNIGSYGRAEGEDRERLAPGFYPVAEHLRLLDPEVVLIVGPRGSGKTEIARVLTDADLYEAVKGYAPSVRLPDGQSQWLAAYPSGSAGFDPIGLLTFIRGGGDTVDDLRVLWLGYLVRTLREVFTDEERQPLSGILEPLGGDIENITRATRELTTQPIIALDRLDARLEREHRFVFVTYDELDTLGGANWRMVEAGVRGLVAFWATYTRRWRRIRAKVFLRSDLYDRHAKGGGADLAKLAASRVDLAWSDRDLYGLLLKRLANGGAPLQRYVRGVSTIGWRDDGALGQIPEMKRWQDARPLVERMVGPYMGANQKKGLVYRWMLDHVRDGRGRVFPRPFVRLFEQAAVHELRAGQPLKAPRVLQPASLRSALDRVSIDQVTQSRDEWPWLDLLKARLAENPLVPWDRERTVSNLLEHLSDEPEGELPPFSGREWLEYLLELGVFRRRGDGRVDAPDLYLEGLGLRRKGGVKKGR